MANLKRMGEYSPQLLILSSTQNLASFPQCKILSQLAATHLKTTQPMDLQSCLKRTTELMQQLQQTTALSS